MVQGIEIDSKYKHKKRDDEKWLTKDLQDIRKTVENYIDSTRSNSKGEINQSVKKTMTIDGIIAIIFLGIFGSAALIIGIYLQIIKENYIIGTPLVIFGAVFVLAFVIYEKYK